MATSSVAAPACGRCGGAGAAPASSAAPITSTLASAACSCGSAARTSAIRAPTTNGAALADATGGTNGPGDARGSGSRGATTAAVVEPHGAGDRPAAASLGTPTTTAAARCGGGALLVTPSGTCRGPQPSDFTLLRVVGKGGFGRVLQVCHLPTKRIYAMKVMVSSSLLLCCCCLRTRLR